MPVTFTTTTHPTHHTPYTSITALPAAPTPAHHPIPHLGLAPVNAVKVLFLLGFTGPTDTQTAGDQDATDFLARVLIATALTPPMGYLHDRLLQLQDLAQWAIPHNRRVIWTLTGAPTLTR
jgi:hypothetical protein